MHRAPLPRLAFCNRGIYENDLIAGTNERRGNGQDAQRRSGVRTSERWEEEDDFAGPGHCKLLAHCGRYDLLLEHLSRCCQQFVKFFVDTKNAVFSALE